MEQGTWYVRENILFNALVNVDFREQTQIFYTSMLSAPISLYLGRIAQLLISLSENQRCILEGQLYAVGLEDHLNRRLIQAALTNGY